MTEVFITGFVVIVLAIAVGIFLFSQYRGTLREAKNYERGLKMIPMYIHIPPASDDIEAGGRDERDVTEEVLSEAQVLYNIIASTATKGFKSRIYGQRHISFEIIAHEGLYITMPSSRLCSLMLLSRRLPLRIRLLAWRKSKRGTSLVAKVA